LYPECLPKKFYLPDHYAITVIINMIILH